mgnify:CR=1 FL=1
MLEYINDPNDIKQIQPETINFWTEMIYVVF